MHFHYWLRWTTLLIKKTSVCKITAVLYFWQQPHFGEGNHLYRISVVWEIYVGEEILRACRATTVKTITQHNQRSQSTKQAIRAQAGWRLSQIIRLVIDIMKEIKKIQNCLEQNHKCNASSPTECCLLHWWDWGLRIPPIGRLPHWGASTDVVIVFLSFETIYNKYFFC